MVLTWNRAAIAEASWDCVNGSPVVELRFGGRHQPQPEDLVDGDPPW